MDDWDFDERIYKGGLVNVRCSRSDKAGCVMFDAQGVDRVHMVAHFSQLYHDLSCKVESLPSLTF